MLHSTLSLPTTESAKLAEHVAKLQFQRVLSNWAQQLLVLKAQEKDAQIHLKKVA